MRRYVRDGLAIVFISHRLDEVMAIADTVTVLRDGRLVASRPAEGLRERDLVRYIVGEALEELEQAPAVAAPGEVVAALRNVSAGPLRDVSLEARAGEVLGLAGLLGSGRTEVLRTLFGSLKVSVRTDRDRRNARRTSRARPTPWSRASRSCPRSARRRSSRA